MDSHLEIHLSLVKLLLRRGGNGKCSLILLRLDLGGM